MASPKVQKCGSMARLFGGIHFDLIVGLNISSPSSEDCQVITNSCLPYSVYMCVWVWDTVWKRVMYYLAWCRTWFDIVLIRRNHRLSLHLDTHTHTHTHTHAVLSQHDCCWSALFLVSSYSSPSSVSFCSTLSLFIFIHPLSFLFSIILPSLTCGYYLNWR